MASRSRGYEHSEGSLPSRLRYVGSQGQEAHSAWCRSFKRYMRQIAPVAYQMMTGELTKPNPLPIPGGSTATPYRVSSNEEDSSTSTSSDGPSDTDPVGLTIKSETKAELQDAATAVPDAEKQPGTTPTPAASGSVETEGKKGETAVQRRDSAGRFTSAPDAGDGTAPPAASTAVEDAATKAVDAKRRQERAARREKRRKRKMKRKRRAAKSTLYSVKALVKRNEYVRKLSNCLVELSEYASMDVHVQWALWKYNSSILWGKLTAALGDRYSYLLARMDTEDGLKAWGIVNRRHSESSAASESHYLKLFLSQKLETSAANGEKPSMRTYIEKLSELAELYMQSRKDGGGIDPRLWKMKLLDLPPFYSDAVTALEIAGAEAKARGEAERTYESIADYVIDFETRRRRKRDMRVAERGGSDRRSNRDPYHGMLTAAKLVLGDARSDDRALTKEELEVLYVTQNQLQQLLEAKAEEAEGRDHSHFITAAKLALEGHDGSFQLGLASAITHQNASQWDTETYDDEDAADHELAVSDFDDDSGSSSLEYRDEENGAERYTLQEEHMRVPTYPSDDQEGRSSVFDSGSYAPDGSGSIPEEGKVTEYYDHAYGFGEDQKEDEEARWEYELEPGMYGGVLHTDTYDDRW